MLRAILAAFALASASGSASRPVSVSRYAATVHAARLFADRLASHADGTRGRHLRSTLSELSRVRLPDGSVIRTNLPSLARQLSDSATSRRTVARALDRLDDALSNGSRHAARASDARALRAVLADPRFHPSENVIQRFDRWLSDQIDRFLEWIAEQLGRLFTGRSGPIGINISAFPIAVLFLGAIALLVFLLGRGALRRSVKTVDIPDDDEQEPRTSHAASSRLDEAIGVGDFRSALRYLFLLTLLQLQERNALQLRPGATNREYLNDLRADSALAARLGAPLGELIDTFDRVWYGHFPIDAQGLDHCRGLARQVVDRAQPGAAA